MSNSVFDNNLDNLNEPLKKRFDLKQNDLISATNNINAYKDTIHSPVVIKTMKTIFLQPPYEHLSLIHDIPVTIEVVTGNIRVQGVNLEHNQKYYQKSGSLLIETYSGSFSKTTTNPELKPTVLRAKIAERSEELFAEYTADSNAQYKKYIANYERILNNLKSDDPVNSVHRDRNHVVYDSMNLNLNSNHHLRNSSLVDGRSEHGYLPVNSSRLYSRPSLHPNSLLSSNIYSSNHLSGVTNPHLGGVSGMGHMVTGGAGVGISDSFSLSQFSAYRSPPSHYGGSFMDDSLSIANITNLTNGWNQEIIPENHLEKDNFPAPFSSYGVETPKEIGNQMILPDNSHETTFVDTDEYSAWFRQRTLSSLPFSSLQLAPSVEMFPNPQDCVMLKIEYLHHYCPCHSCNEMNLVLETLCSDVDHSKCNRLDQNFLPSISPSTSPSTSTISKEKDHLNGSCVIDPLINGNRVSMTNEGFNALSNETTTENMVLDLAAVFMGIPIADKDLVPSPFFHRTVKNPSQYTSKNSKDKMSLKLRNDVDKKSCLKSNTPLLLLHTLSKSTDQSVDCVTLTNNADLNRDTTDLDKEGVQNKADVESAMLNMTLDTIHESTEVPETPIKSDKLANEVGVLSPDRSEFQEEMVVDTHVSCSLEKNTPVSINADANINLVETTDKKCEKEKEDDNIRLILRQFESLVTSVEYIFTSRKEDPLIILNGINTILSVFRVLMEREENKGKKHSKKFKDSSTLFQPFDGVGGLVIEVSKGLNLVDFSIETFYVELLHAVWVFHKTHEEEYLTRLLTHYYFAMGLTDSIEDQTSTPLNTEFSLFSLSRKENLTRRADEFTRGMVDSRGVVMTIVSDLTEMIQVKDRVLDEHLQEIDEHLATVFTNGIEMKDSKVVDIDSDAFECQAYSILDIYDRAYSLNTRILTPFLTSSDNLTGKKEIVQNTKDNTKIRIGNHQDSKTGSPDIILDVEESQSNLDSVTIVREPGPGKKKRRGRKGKGNQNPNNSNIEDHNTLDLSGLCTDVTSKSDSLATSPSALDSKNLSDPISSIQEGHLLSDLVDHMTHSVDHTMLDKDGMSKDIDVVELSKKKVRRGKRKGNKEEVSTTPSLEEKVSDNTERTADTSVKPVFPLLHSHNDESYQKVDLNTESNSQFTFSPSFPPSLNSPSPTSSPLHSSTNIIPKPSKSSKNWLSTPLLLPLSQLLTSSLTRVSIYSLADRLLKLMIPRTPLKTSLMYPLKSTSTHRPKPVTLSTLLTGHPSVSLTQTFVKSLAKNNDLVALVSLNHFDISSSSASSSFSTSHTQSSTGSLTLTTYIYQGWMSADSTSSGLDYLWEPLLSESHVHCICTPSHFQAYPRYFSPAGTCMSCFFSQTHIALQAVCNRQSQVCLPRGCGSKHHLNILCSDNNILLNLPFVRGPSYKADVFEKEFTFRCMCEAGRYDRMHLNSDYDDEFGVLSSKHPNHKHKVYRGLKSQGGSRIGSSTSFYDNDYTKGNSSYFLIKPVKSSDSSYDFSHDTSRNSNNSLVTSNNSNLRSSQHSSTKPEMSPSPSPSRPSLVNEDSVNEMEYESNLSESHSGFGYYSKQSDISGFSNVSSSSQNSRLIPPTYSHVTSLSDAGSSNPSRGETNSNNGAGAKLIEEITFDGIRADSSRVMDRTANNMSSNFSHPSDSFHNSFETADISGSPTNPSSLQLSHQKNSQVSGVSTGLSGRSVGKLNYPLYNDAQDYNERNQSQGSSKLPHLISAESGGHNSITLNSSSRGRSQSSGPLKCICDKNILDHRHLAPLNVHVLYDLTLVPSASTSLKDIYQSRSRVGDLGVWNVRGMRGVNNPIQTPHSTDSDSHYELFIKNLLMSQSINSIVYLPPSFYSHYTPSTHLTAQLKLNIRLASALNIPLIPVYVPKFSPICPLTTSNRILLVNHYVPHTGHILPPHPSSDTQAPSDDISVQDAPSILALNNPPQFDLTNVVPEKTYNNVNYLDQHKRKTQITDLTDDLFFPSPSLQPEPVIHCPDDEMIDQISIHEVKQGKSNISYSNYLDKKIYSNSKINNASSTLRSISPSNQSDMKSSEASSSTKVSLTPRSAITISSGKSDVKMMSYSPEQLTCRHYSSLFLDNPTALVVNTREIINCINTRFIVLHTEYDSCFCTHCLTLKHSQPNPSLSTRRNIDHDNDIKNLGSSSLVPLLCSINTARQSTRCDLQTAQPMNSSHIGATSVSPHPIMFAVFLLPQSIQDPVQVSIDDRVYPGKYKRRSNPDVYEDTDSDEDGDRDSEKVMNSPHYAHSQCLVMCSSNFQFELQELFQSSCSVYPERGHKLRQWMRRRPFSVDIQLNHSLSSPSLSSASSVHSHATSETIGGSHIGSSVSTVSSDRERNKTSITTTTTATTVNNVTTTTTTTTRTTTTRVVTSIQEGFLSSCEVYFEGGKKQSTNSRKQSFHSTAQMDTPSKYTHDLSTTIVPNHLKTDLHPSAIVNTSFTNPLHSNIVRNSVLSECGLSNTYSDVSSDSVIIADDLCVDGDQVVEGESDNEEKDEEERNAVAMRNTVSFCSRSSRILFHPLPPWHIAADFSCFIQFHSLLKSCISNLDLINSQYNVNYHHDNHIANTINRNKIITNEHILNEALKHLSHVRPYPNYLQAYQDNISNEFLESRHDYQSYLRQMKNRATNSNLGLLNIKIKDKIQGFRYDLQRVMKWVFRPRHLSDLDLDDEDDDEKDEDEGYSGDDENSSITRLWTQQTLARFLYVFDLWKSKHIAKGDKKPLTNWKRPQSGLQSIMRKARMRIKSTSHENKVVHRFIPNHNYNVVTQDTHTHISKTVAGTNLSKPLNSVGSGFEGTSDTSNSDVFTQSSLTTVEPLHNARHSRPSPQFTLPQYLVQLMDIKTLHEWAIEQKYINVTNNLTDYYYSDKWCCSCVYNCMSNLIFRMHDYSTSILSRYTHNLSLLRSYQRLRTWWRECKVKDDVVLTQPPNMHVFNHFNANSTSTDSLSSTDIDFYTNLCKPEYMHFFIAYESAFQIAQEEGDVSFDTDHDGVLKGQKMINNSSQYSEDSIDVTTLSVSSEDGSNMGSNSNSITSLFLKPNLQYNKYNNFVFSSLLPSWRLSVTPFIQQAYIYFSLQSHFASSLLSSDPSLDLHQYIVGFDRKNHQMTLTKNYLYDHTPTFSHSPPISIYIDHQNTNHNRSYRSQGHVRIETGFQPTTSSPLVFTDSVLTVVPPNHPLFNMYVQLAKYKYPYSSSPSLESTQSNLSPPVYQTFDNSSTFVWYNSVLSIFSHNILLVLWPLMIPIYIVIEITTIINNFSFAQAQMHPLIEKYVLKLLTMVQEVLSMLFGPVYKSGPDVCVTVDTTSPTLHIKEDVSKLYQDKIVGKVRKDENNHDDSFIPLNSSDLPLARDVELPEHPIATHPQFELQSYHAGQVNNTLTSFRDDNLSQTTNNTIWEGYDEDLPLLTRSYSENNLRENTHLDFNLNHLTFTPPPVSPPTSSDNSSEEKPQLTFLNYLRVLNLTPKLMYSEEPSHPVETDQDCSLNSSDAVYQGKTTTLSFDPDFSPPHQRPSLVMMGLYLLAFLVSCVFTVDFFLAPYISHFGFRLVLDSAITLYLLTYILDLKIDFKHILFLFVLCLVAFVMWLVYILRQYFGG